MSSSSVLAVRALGDVVLHHVAPLGLAAAAGTALVIDLDRRAQPLSSRRSLADLCEAGPTGSDLTPPRRGVAVIGCGGIGWEEGAAMVSALARGWPAVVVRCGVDDRPELPIVPVIAALPDVVRPVVEGPWVAQSVAGMTATGAPSLVLPPLSRTRLRWLLAGRVDPRWRWVRAWRPAWEAAWV